MSASDRTIDTRVHCPCCAYPTLSARNADEICPLCSWEDDGQGDHDADTVRGGPNGDYSLAEARENFRRYLVMYRPDDDPRCTGPDSAIELQAKRVLIDAFERLRTAVSSHDRLALHSTILSQEAVLEAELERSVRAYEAKRRAEGSA